MVRRYEGYARSLLEFQVVVFAALLVVGTALLVGGPNTLNPVLYISGAGLIGLVTVVTVLWRKTAWLQSFSLALPLLDIVGIRLTVVADQAAMSGGALLLILPIIWIAYSFGPVGFAVCLALVAVTSPQSFFANYVDFDSADFARLIAFPLILVVLAGAAGISGARIRRKRVELAAQTELTEQAVRQRDRLIEAVTHELRTPLTSILGNAELVLEDSGQMPLVQQRAAVIVRNAEQMEAMFADLLMARSTAVREPPLEYAATDLRRLVAECRETRLVSADVRGITISVSEPMPGVPSPFAEVDANRVRQVVDNLLSNAIKYNRVGGTVTVSVTSDADTVTLAVADSGGGIADEDRSRVFEAYYRTPSARTSDQAGTGLGLGISRHIARRHGGDLRLTRSSPAGSRFELTLPVGRRGL
ncbi:sensor histidine kinase [Cryobacterium melibiosiphilum]|uniref:histidine kinase n=1 Tax=Cryobacterium melibiosiphilum TaxID=995039 RepID=A0A3A5MHW2_9MICO|nr:HAMP domain-containing sensor histidine kinase [Cryobacterium melibiosiphilum]RJT89737.1 sensor histidine kinase [Cryobacterium melibiosiphilum]